MEKIPFSLISAVFWFCAAVWIRVDFFNQSRILQEKEIEFLRTSGLIKLSNSQKTSHRKEVRQLKEKLDMTHVRFCLAACCCIVQLLIIAGFKAFSS